jgi:predicted dehydrogenase
MQYVVIFEHATAEFAFDGTPRVELHREGATESIELETYNGYDGEVRHLLAAIRAETRDLDATAEDAVGLTAMLVAEGESLRTGHPVPLEE